jgi:aminobenzoyl-glutamate transport protein
VAKVGDAGAGATEQVEPKRGWLDRVERLGNKVPHPAIIFLSLCLLVIVLSWVLSLFSVSVTYEVA